MRRNKKLRLGILSVLVLIITVHVALFSKYKHDREIFFNMATDQTTHSWHWFEGILYVPAKF